MNLVHFLILLQEYHAELVQRFAQMKVTADDILEGEGEGSSSSGVVANLTPANNQDCVEQLLGSDSTA